MNDVLDRLDGVERRLSQLERLMRVQGDGSAAAAARLDDVEHQLHDVQVAQGEQAVTLARVEGRLASLANLATVQRLTLDRLEAGQGRALAHLEELLRRQLQPRPSAPPPPLALPPEVPGG
jgi:hypothetical protein